MYKFSQKSKDKLLTCDIRIQEIMNEVIKHWDCSILEGYRDQETQDEYFRQGKSQIKYPNGKHNSSPSKAIDVMAYPIDWNDWNRMYAFVGFVQGIAAAKGHTLRSGLDWDQDRDFRDQSFNDAPHLEIID